MKENDIEKVVARISDLNRQQISPMRNKKLPWYKKMVLKLTSWYVDSIAEEVWESNQKSVVIFEELTAFYKQLLQSNLLLTEKIKEQENLIQTLKSKATDLDRKHAEALTEFQDWCRARFDGQDVRFTSNEEFQDWCRARFDGQDVRFTSNEEFQDWCRARFDGQDVRFTSNEEFQDWCRARFDGQDVRFTSNEEFQDWCRARFDGQDVRFTSNEEFQDWCRARFDGQDVRFTSNEEFQDWCRARFDSLEQCFNSYEEIQAGFRLDSENLNGQMECLKESQDLCNFNLNSHEQRLSDIEGREIWARHRFEETFDRLYRLDEIVDYSIDKKQIFVPAEKSDGFTVNKVMLNNRIFEIVSDENAKDSISLSVGKSKISCANLDLLHLFSTPGVFLDLGANIGVFSLSLASQGWKGIAFEAGENNFRLLKQSIERNHFEITAVNKAVYSKSGDIYFSENGLFGFIENDVVENKDFNKISAIALDDYLEELKQSYPSIDLIKIDIEGSEPAALRGMQKLLQSLKYPPLFVEINAYTLSLQKETPATLAKELQELGYICCEYRFDQLFECDMTVFQMEACVDRLFLHGSQAAEYRIQPGETAGEESVLQYIVQKLTKVLEDESLDVNGDQTANDNYVCYLLKDFPEYTKNNTISRLLHQIKQTRTESKYLQRVLEWLE